MGTIRRDSGGVACGQGHSTQRKHAAFHIREYQLPSWPFVGVFLSGRTRQLVSHFSDVLQLPALRTLAQAPPHPGGLQDSPPGVFTLPGSSYPLAPSEAFPALEKDKVEKKACPGGGRQPLTLCSGPTLRQHM